MKTQAGRRTGNGGAGSGGVAFRPKAQRRSAGRPSGGREAGAGGPYPEDSTANLGALVAQAQAAVSSSANVLRDVRERYRAAYLEHVDHWQRLRSMLAGAPRADSDGEAAPGDDTLRRDEAVATQEVGAERSALARIELAVKSLESAWLFLAREDNSLVGDMTSPASPADLQMRIVEAQEGERSRMAREIHDGPAQALSNAIFQVEVVQRLLDRDEAMARAELQGLRDMLTRELRGVRVYLSQLRLPLLADLGLSGAIRETAGQIGAALDIPIDVELDNGVDSLPETVEIVILRVIQEALQNARKHAAAQAVSVSVASDDEGGWTVEVRDDGRGFDPDGRSDAPNRNFGLLFMRERAELIGAGFEVRSGQNLGTVVRMSIPPGAMGMPIPGEVLE